MGIAGNELMNFIWNDFCSSYIEFTKATLTGDDLTDKHKTLNTLIYCLDAIIRLLHPFIPFVTEELCQAIHGEDTTICTALWPQKKGCDDAKARKIDILLEIIKASREIRTESNIKPSKELEIMIDGFDINENEISILNKMCKLNVTDCIDEETIVRPITDGKISFRMSEIVNKEEEQIGRAHV